MYVLSFGPWRRRFGPWVRTFLIAAAVLGALFFAYRLFVAPAPAIRPLRPEAAPAGRTGAGEGGGSAERWEDDEGSSAPRNGRPFALWTREG